MTLTATKPNIKKTALIVALWVVVQTVMFLKNGIVTSGEALKYIWQADQFLQTGAPTSANYWFYFTQILLIALDKIFAAQLVLVISIQLGVSLLATFSFYQLLTHIFSEKIAMVGIVLFLLNYPYHEFNTFAQTESLYFGLTLILSSYLLRLNTVRKKNIIILCSLLLILIFTRPTGILFIPPVLIYLRLQFPNKIRLYLIAAALAPVILILSLAMASGGKLDFMLPFKTNQVICGVPREQDSMIKVAENGNSILGIIYYITHNLTHFTKLAVQKTIAFWGLTRTYFSAWHNLFLAVFFYVLYLGIVLSFRHWLSKKKYYFIYFCSAIIITWLTAILTCDDWHNRFFLALSPYLIILSLPAIIKLTSIISSNTFFRSRY